MPVTPVPPLPADAATNRKFVVDEGDDRMRRSIDGRPYPKYAAEPALSQISVQRERQRSSEHHDSR